MATVAPFPISALADPLKNTAFTDSLSTSKVGFVVEPSLTDGCFAIARVQGAIRLIQVPRMPASALAAIDLTVFRHEFIHIFRVLEKRAMHPADVHILERIDAGAVTCDEDSDSVFLAKAVLERLSRLTSPVAHRYGAIGMGHSRSSSHPPRQHRRH